MPEIKMSVSVADIEPMSQLIDILIRHMDDLPEELRSKIIDVLDRHGVD